MHVSLHSETWGWWGEDCKTVPWMPYPVKEDVESVRALWSCVTLHKALSLHAGQWNGEKGGLQTGKTPPSPLIHTLCPYAGLGTYMYTALVLWKKLDPLEKNTVLGQTYSLGKKVYQ